MPPKVKVTREEIIDAAVVVVRDKGAQALNARMVASTLGCSTQPIFSNFATMDELRLSVVKQADELCNEYMRREMASGEFPAYKASGMAYIRFAKEETELFKLLYMRDRSRENTDRELRTDDGILAMVRENTGLVDDGAKRFHLEMWAYVHGIAAMIATGYLDLDRALVSRMLTDAYQGLKKQYETEG